MVHCPIPSVLSSLPCRHPLPFCPTLRLCLPSTTHTPQENPPSSTMTSLAKQNFSNVVEDAVNQQINLEMIAAHTYLAIAAYMGADAVALPGFEKYFREQAQEEREHAQILMDYQNRRGGRVVIQTIPAPSSEWQSAKNAVESALQLEKDVNKSLLRIESLAEEHHDANFVNMLRSLFLKEQVHSIAEISKLVTQLNRVGGEGLGLYILDQTLLKEGVGAIVGN